MTKKEADLLRRRIREQVDAEIQDARKGGGDPDAIPEIEANLKARRAATNALIRAHTDPEPAKAPAQKPKGK